MQGFFPNKTDALDYFLFIEDLTLFCNTMVHTLLRILISTLAHTSVIR
jgi:hypothetical protein